MNSRSQSDTEFTAGCDGTFVVLVCRVLI